MTVRIKLKTRITLHRVNKIETEDSVKMENHAKITEHLSLQRFFFTLEEVGFFSN